jgi:acetyl esterase/lipase
MTNPEYLSPFVLPVETREAERHGAVDVYLPDAPLPQPAIIFVHGGPVPAQFRPTPRDWPMYRGYGSLAASRGIVGVTLDHRLYTPIAHKDAAEDVVAAVEFTRADPRVDGDRVALWFFSGGSLLAADWLREAPAWLRCLAVTYPLLAPFPGWPVDPRFLPADAVAAAGSLPLVLTRVGRENPQVAEGVEAFVNAAHAAGAQLEIIDVPNGGHSFDILDATDESRDAINLAFATVTAHLTA